MRSVALTGCPSGVAFVLLSVVPLVVVLSALLLTDVRLLGVIILLSGRGPPLAVLVESVRLPLVLLGPVGVVLATLPLAHLPVALAVLIGVRLLAHVPVADPLLAVLAAILGLPVGVLSLLPAGGAHPSLRVLVDGVGGL